MEVIELFIVIALLKNKVARDIYKSTATKAKTGA